MMRKIIILCTILILLCVPMASAEIRIDGGKVDTYRRLTISDLFVLDADPSIIFNTITATDTDFWFGVQEDAGGDDDDVFQIGKGIVPGTTPYVTIDKDGKVGIAIASPVKTLDVVGDIQFTGLLSESSATRIIDGEFRGKNGTASNPTYCFNNDLNTGIFLGATDEIGLTTAGVECMRIDATGEIGIATTSPAVQLHVAKNSSNTSTVQEMIRSEVTSTNTVAAGFGCSRNVYLEDASGNAAQQASSIGTIWTDPTHASEDSAVTISGVTAGGAITEAVRIVGGNVGIGTTVPDKKLEINTGAATGGIRTSYNDGDGSAVVYTDILTDSSGNTTFNNTGGTINVMDSLVMDVGANITGGSLEFTTDSGAVELVDMPVSASSADGTEVSVALAVDNGNIFKIYAESNGAGAVDTRQTHQYGDTGVVKRFVYQNTALADDGTVNLPDATGGHVTTTCNGETIICNIQTDGVCTKVAGTTNTDDADTDTTLCVYDGGTYAIVKNRLGTIGRIEVVYEFY